MLLKKPIVVSFCHHSLKALILKDFLLFIHALKILHNFWKPFFENQWLTNAVSFPLNSSISSEPVSISVSEFRARKNKTFETWHYGVNFPHPTQAKVAPPGKPSRQIPHPKGTENNQISGVSPWGVWSFPCKIVYVIEWQLDWQKEVNEVWKLPNWRLKVSWSCPLEENVHGSREIREIGRNLNLVVYTF